MELEKLLKELKRIEPDSAYSARSKSALLATLAIEPRPSLEKKGFLSVFPAFFLTKPALAAQTVAVILVIVAGGWYLNRQSNESLVVEANEVNSSIQVKLNEIDYLLKNKQPAFSPEKTRELNLLLQQAEEALRIAHEDLNTANLVDSLDKLKNAEETFSRFENAANTK